jgi:hypothetical protein
MAFLPFAGIAAPAIAGRSNIPPANRRAELRRKSRLFVISF